MTRRRECYSALLFFGVSISCLLWERDLAHDTQVAVAFAMGRHPRLGSGSLEEELLRMILQGYLAYKKAPSPRTLL